MFFNYLATLAFCKQVFEALPTSLCLLISRALRYVATAN